MATNYLIQTLATFAEPNYKYTLSLDNNIYVINFAWNERGQFWCVSLYTDDLIETIIESVKVVLDVDLLQYANGLFTPRGALVALSDVATEITFDNFSVDVQLQYLTNN